MTTKIVGEGYNKIAENYTNQRHQFENVVYLEKLANLLPQESKILDVGCGAGVPVDKFFAAKGYKVYGIDLSKKMIELAKENVPLGHFEVKGMGELKSYEYKVNAVVSFYAIFHTPREAHEELLRKFSSFLDCGGFLLVTMGSSEWEGEEDFHGTKMYWSQYGPEKNREIIKRAGFEITLDEIDLSGGEKHQVILAKKT